jgi:hypothetical protein
VRGFCLLALVALAVLSIATPLLAADKSPGADDSWKALRQQAINRPRRIIFNNDGNEPVYFCKSATAEGLLQPRTSPLIGSQVDSIFYCTWSSGFGMFTHNTKVGQVFNTREALFATNRTQELLDRGLDPLQVMADFAHQHHLELFWSLRMNDTHDGSRTAYGPVMFRANKLKQEHPDYLIGSRDKPPKHGAWSAVDFGVPEVRELAFRYCEEVCRNYAVDGLELDFFRHAFFFKCSGRGDSCGEAELSQMSALVRRIRAMAEEAGRKRNRPILLAIRVPDSVGYCKLIGLDLEKWLAEGLVDLLVVGGYTQLNPWPYSVALGHKYGVKVYPSLDEPRVRDQTANELRSSLATYRGRALEAWSAGVDGIYMFNYFDPRSSLWRELGDPAALVKLDRNYFPCARGPGSMPMPHQKFIHISNLNPANPITIEPAKPAHIEFFTGEAFSAGEPPRNITLRLRFKSLTQPKELRVTLNGKPLSSPQTPADWLNLPLQEHVLEKGANSLEISCSSGSEEMPSLLDLYFAVR